MKLAQLLRVFVIAAASLGTLRLYAAPAETVQFTRTFYTIEIVVFARDSHVEPSDGERLELTEPRRFPGGLSAFAASNAERARIYRLESNEDLEPFAGAPARTELSPDPTASAATPAIPPAPPTEKERIEKELAELELRWTAESLALRPTSELRLTSQANRLSRSGTRVVWHGAWLQRVPDRDNEPHQPLLVQFGDRMDDGGFEAEGEIDVTRGRFLHFDAALWFRASTPGSYFELAESRRMRSGELNYLDHPKYGVLVRIDPVELPADLTAAVQALDEAQ